MIPRNRGGTDPGGQIYKVLWPLTDIRGAWRRKCRRIRAEVGFQIERAEQLRASAFCSNVGQVFCIRMTSDT